MAAPIQGRIQLDGGDEIQRALGEMGRAGQNFFVQLSQGFRSLGELSLPTDKIKRDLVDVGTLGKEQLAEISKAAKAVDLTIPVDKPKNALAELKGVAEGIFAGIKTVVDGVRGNYSALTSDLQVLKGKYDDVAKSAKGLTGAVSGNPIKSLLVGAGVVAGVAGLFKIVKDGVRDFDDLGGRVDEANEKLKKLKAPPLDIEKLQELRFLLREIGASSTDVDKQIEAQIDAVVADADKATEKLIDEYRSFTSKMTGTGPGAGKIITIKELVTPEGIEALAKEVALLDDYDKQLDRATKFFGSADIGTKFVDSLEDDAGTITKFRETFLQLRKVVTDRVLPPESLQPFAKELERVNSEAQRLDLAMRKFGGQSDLAERFVSLLKPLDFIGPRTAQFGPDQPQQDKLKAFIDDYKKLRDAQTNLNWDIKSKDFGSGLSDLTRILRGQPVSGSRVWDELQKGATAKAGAAGAGADTTAAMLANLETQAKSLGEEFDSEDFAPFVQKLARVKDEAKQLDLAVKAMGGEEFKALGQRLIDALKESGGETLKTDTFLRRLKQSEEDLTAENIVSIGDALRRAKEQARDTGAAVGDLAPVQLDLAKQIEIATKAFGGQEAQARKFVDAVNSGKSEVESFAEAFGKLPQVQKTNQDVAQEFNTAQMHLKQSLVEVGFAAEQSKIALGLTFAPALTPIIEGIANGIRFLNIDVRTFARDIGGNIKPVIEDFFKLFSSGTEGGKASLGSFVTYVKEKGGAITKVFSSAAAEGDTTPEIKTTWLLTLRDAVVSAGEAIRDVFDNVIKPAFVGAKAIAVEVATAINETFGTKVTAAFVGLTAVLAFFTGGWGALGVAALAAVGAITSVGDKVEGVGSAFRGVGIDIGAIKEKLQEFGRTVLTSLGVTGEFNFADKLKGALTSLPVLVLAAVATFLLLRSVAGSIAPTLSSIFFGAAEGVKQLTANSVLSLASLLQMTGVLPTLSNMFGALGSAAQLVFATLSTFGLLLGGFAALVGWPIVLVGGIVLLLTHLDQAKAALQYVADGINAIFGTKLTGGELLVVSIALLVAGLVKLTLQATLATAEIGLLALRFAPVAAAITATAAAVYFLYQQFAKSAPVVEKQKEIDDLHAAFARGEISMSTYTARWNQLRKELEEAKSKPYEAPRVDAVADSTKEISASWKQMTQDVLGNLTSLVTGSDKATDKIKKNNEELRSKGVYKFGDTLSDEELRRKGVYRFPAPKESSAPKESAPQEKGEKSEALRLEKVEADAAADALRRLNDERDRGGNRGGRFNADEDARDRVGNRGGLNESGDRGGVYLQDRGGPNPPQQEEVAKGFWGRLLEFFSVGKAGAAEFSGNRDRDGGGGGETFARVVDQLRAAIESFRAAAESFSAAIGEFRSGFSGVVSSFSTAVNEFKTVIDGIAEKLKTVFDKLIENFDKTLQRYFGLKQLEENKSSASYGYGRVNADMTIGRADYPQEEALTGEKAKFGDQYSQMMDDRRPRDSYGDVIKDPYFVPREPRPPRGDPQRLPDPKPGEYAPLLSAADAPAQNWVNGVLDYLGVGKGGLGRRRFDGAGAPIADPSDAGRAPSSLPDVGRASSEQFPAQYPDGMRTTADGVTWKMEGGSWKVHTRPPAPQPPDIAGPLVDTLTGKAASYRDPRALSRLDRSIIDRPAALDRSIIDRPAETSQQMARRDVAAAQAEFERHYGVGADWVTTPSGRRAMQLGQGYDVEDIRRGERLAGRPAWQEPTPTPPYSRPDLSGNRSIIDNNLQTVGDTLKNTFDFSEAQSKAGEFVSGVKRAFEFGEAKQELSTFGQEIKTGLDFSDVKSNVAAFASELRQAMDFSSVSASIQTFASALSSLQQAAGAASAGGGLKEIGHFASGGRPPLGRASLVGEEGPELFVPDTAGTVMSNSWFSGLRSMMASLRNISFDGLADRLADAIGPSSLAVPGLTGAGAGAAGNVAGHYMLTIPLSNGGGVSVMASPQAIDALAAEGIIQQYSATGKAPSWNR